MKKIIALTLLGASLLSSGAYGQTTDTLKTRPGQVSFFYPLGTNGIESPSYINNVSFNILYGINGGLNGVEIGGLVNTNLGDVNGVQFAGIANINTKHSNAIMFGGITNIVKDTSNAVCFAGISNVLGGSSIGLNFAGIMNTVNGTFTGGQFAGISNVVNGSVVGTQMSGISNVTNGNFIGLQAAGISNLVNGDLQGAQFGLINAAKKVKGFQLGLINVADSFEKGVPLGLFSFVKKGFHAIEFSGAESIQGNVTVKMGVDRLYTIYKAGFATNNEDNYLTYGLGLGSMHSFGEKAKISLDLSLNHVLQPNTLPRFDFLARADAAFRYHINKHIGFFAGPSFSIYGAQHDVLSETTALNVPYTVYKDYWWNASGSTSIWFGGNAGVSIMF